MHTEGSGNGSSWAGGHKPRGSHGFFSRLFSSAHNHSNSMSNLPRRYKPISPHLLNDPAFSPDPTSHPFHAPSLSITDRATMLEEFPFPKSQGLLPRTPGPPLPPANRLSQESVSDDDSDVDALPMQPPNSPLVPDAPSEHKSRLNGEHGYDIDSSIKPSASWSGNQGLGSSDSSESGSSSTSPTRQSSIDPHIPNTLAVNGEPTMAAPSSHLAAKPPPPDKRNRVLSLFYRKSTPTSFEPSVPRQERLTSKLHKPKPVTSSIPLSKLETTPASSISHPEPPPATRNASAPDLREGVNHVQLPPRSSTTPNTKSSRQPNPVHHPTRRKGALDSIDELDETNPLGLHVHHGGPYEAISRLVNNQQSRKQNFRHVPINTSSDNSRVAMSPQPVSFNIVPGQIVPRDFALGASVAGLYPHSVAGQPPHHTLPDSGQSSGSSQSSKFRSRPTALDERSPETPGSASSLATYSDHGDPSAARKRVDSFVPVDSPPLPTTVPPSESNELPGMPEEHFPAPEPGRRLQSAPSPDYGKSEAYQGNLEISDAHRDLYRHPSSMPTAGTRFWPIQSAHGSTLPLPSAPNAQRATFNEPHNAETGAIDNGRKDSEAIPDEVDDQLPRVSHVPSDRDNEGTSAALFSSRAGSTAPSRYRGPPRRNSHLPRRLVMPAPLQQSPSNPHSIMNNDLSQPDLSGHSRVRGRNHSQLLSPPVYAPRPEHRPPNLVQNGQANSLADSQPVRSPPYSHDLYPRYDAVFTHNANVHTGQKLPFSARAQIIPVSTDRKVLRKKSVLASGGSVDIGMAVFPDPRADKWKNGKEEEYYDGRRTKADGRQPKRFLSKRRSEV